MESIQKNNKILLQTRNLKKHFPINSGLLKKTVGRIKAVDGVDLDIERGRTLGLVGESGCGKSTLARLILKLLPSDKGQIIFQGQDISRYSEAEMKPLRREMQIVFQDPYGSLNPRMTVGQSIGEGLRILGFRKAPEIKERIAELLQMVGLNPESADRYPHEFSGGQRQRVGIARALSVEPSFVICDEPISALDVSIQAQIINLLRGLQEKLRLSYLFISHDLNVVGYLCDRVAVMFSGRIVEYARTEAIFENPRHPYTLALLSAIPEALVGKKPQMKPIITQESSPGTRSEGCPYLPNCNQGDSMCEKSPGDWIEVETGHYVRCWTAESQKRNRL